MNRLPAAVLLAHLLLLCMAAESPAFHKFRYGGVSATVVSDGPVFFHDNPFSVPEQAVKKAYRNLKRSVDPITLQQNVLFIDLPRVGRVMIDTGSRADEPSPFSPESGQLFENMKRAGIAPNSVDHILLTHGHLDHVNGLRAIGGGRAFPNAQVYISRREHMFWTNPLMTPNATDSSPEALQFFAFSYLNAIDSYKDRLHLVGKQSRVLPGIRFIHGPGHSPGHCAIQIRLGNKYLIVSGDTWVSAPDQLRHPSWGFEYESNHIQAVKSRIRLLSRSEKKTALVLAYHEEFPGLGYIKKKKNPYRKNFEWVPARV